MAKSEEGRWLTYEELAKELGSTVQAARILAVRRKYPRRIPNSYGERTRVLVPENVEIPRRRRGRVGDTEPPTDAEHRSTDDPDRAPLIRAVETLTDQLRAANERADRAEKRADEERQMRLDAERKIDAIRDFQNRLDSSEAERRQALDRLAAAQERIAALLTDQRPAPPLPARRSWWRWRRERIGA